MTSKLLYRVFSDGESLHDYECHGIMRVNACDVVRRLIAMERVDDAGKKTDAYYDGMGCSELKDYHSIYDMVGAFPRQIAREFLVKREGVLYVREDKFEEWNSLKCKLSPLWIIAGFLSDIITTDVINNQQQWSKFKIESTKQFKHTALLLPYIPDLDYFVRQKGGLNDLHIHLNGSTEADVIWCYMLSHPYITADDYNTEFYRNTKLRKHAEQVTFGLTPELLLRRLLKAICLRKRILEFLCSKRFCNYRFGFDLQDELLFYIIVIKYLNIFKNEHIAKLFHYYMLIKGLVQSFVVMQQSQIGFSQFQLLTDNTFRYRQESYYKQRFLQLASGCNIRYIRLIEGRFSPKRTVAENYKLIRRILRGFEKAQKETKGLLEGTNLVLIAHFIKRPEIESEKEHFVRNYYLRKDLKRKAISLMMLKNGHSKIGDVIKGVDAAASEFDARPEVFAPTFNFLRESGMNHFTYHVGEDFCHLLSGLRAVYEAIEFLQLQSGDRLGHCTALGILPKFWQDKIGKYCYMSRGEWLDNLVFVWYLIKKGMLDFSQSVIYGIERRIAELEVVIYDDVFLPHELSEAWLLRRYVPIEELNSYFPNYSYESFIHNKVVKKYKTDKTKQRIHKLWVKYHEGIKYTSDKKECLALGRCRCRYDEVIRIESDEVLGANELQQIQNILLNLLSEKNIIIEALPSSNMRISLYDNLQDYHLKQWLNVDMDGRQQPTVVLGSDDPGIFMTNIYNEYALAYLHLKLNKYAPSKRIENIKYIHEQSEIYCFDDGRQ